MMECKCENIVGYDACYLVKRQLWIVMELCAGGALNDLMLLAGRTFSEAQIAVCVKDMLNALVYLHDHHRIHRDIKAGNVFLTGEGVPKLGDFGVSSTVSTIAPMRHSVIGSPFWMAPEVIHQDGHNYKADIWSLGITMIELAEGHVPLSHLSRFRAMFLIPSRPPPKLSDPTKWSDEMNDFIAACLSKEPNMRPTARQLLDHPWLFKHADAEHSILKPLIEAADKLIKAKGGRENALNAIYEEEEEEEETPVLVSSSSTGPPGGDTLPYDTIVIGTSDGNSSTSPKSGSDTGKYDTGPHKKRDSPSAEDSGTMVFNQEEVDALTNVDDGNGSDEDYGTMKVKRKVGWKEKSLTKSLAGRKTPVSLLREERLGTLARGDSLAVRVVRQELDDIDAHMITRLQALHKTQIDEADLIQSILAQRNA